MDHRESWLESVRNSNFNTEWRERTLEEEMDIQNEDLKYLKLQSANPKQSQNLNPKFNLEPGNIDK